MTQQTILTVTDNLGTITRLTSGIELRDYLCTLLPSHQVRALDDELNSTGRAAVSYSDLLELCAYQFGASTDADNLVRFLTSQMVSPVVMAYFLRLNLAGGHRPSIGNLIY